MQPDFHTLLSLSHCTVLPHLAFAWGTGNSVVVSVPTLSVVPLFPMAPELNVTASLVSIQGDSPEPLHFHTSHLMGLVVRGSGDFRWEVEGEERTAEVCTGDVVIIPRGALHFFNCLPGGSLDYVALEVSDGPIDYQKHFHPNESLNELGNGG